MHDLTKQKTDIREIHFPNIHELNQQDEAAPTTGIERKRNMMYYIKHVQQH